MQFLQYSLIGFAVDHASFMLYADQDKKNRQFGICGYFFFTFTFLKNIYNLQGEFILTLIIVSS